MKNWIILPSNDLTDSVNWKNKNKNTYATSRFKVLMVISKGKHKFGPVIKSIPLESGVTYTLRHKTEKAYTRYDSMTELLRYTISSHWGKEITDKLAAEVGAKNPVFSAQIQTELIEKTQYDLKRDIESLFSGTTSYETKILKEDEYTIELKGNKTGRPAEIRQVLFPTYWDVYLYSAEYLELIYKKNLFWRDLRKTIKQIKLTPLRWKLFRLVFYIPQEEPAVLYRDVKNEIKNPEAIEIRRLGKPYPKTKLKKIMPLEECAKLAFPTTPEEKKRALERRAKAAKRAPRIARKGLTNVAKVALVIKKHHKGINSKTISQKTGLSNKQVTTAVYTLKKDKIIVNKFRGVYIRKEHVKQKAAPLVAKEAKKTKIKTLKPSIKKVSAKRKVKTPPAKTQISTIEQVLNIIKRHKKGISTKDLKKKSGLKEKQISDILYRATKKGKTKRIARGIYRI